LQQNHACDITLVSARSILKNVEWELLAAFFRTLWALFWRSMLVLIINAAATYGLAHLAHAVSEPSDLAVKARLSLAFLPAAILFVLLALNRGMAGALLIEAGSPLSGGQWRRAYLALFAGATFIVIIEIITAPILPTDLWMAMRSLLPMLVFVILWLALAGGLARSPDRTLKA
jgi:hypothetical protein